MAGGLRDDAELANREETITLNSTYKKYVETNEEIRKLKVITNGLGSFLTDVSFVLTQLLTFERLK